MPEILFDCRVISNFAQAGALGVLEKLYPGSGMITDFVAAEVWRGIQAGHEELGAVTEAVRAGLLLQVGLDSDKEKLLFGTLSRSLGAGDASSLAVASVCGFRLASDDLAARREALTLGIKLTGTVGILRRAVETGILDRKSADRFLRKMIGGGFYSPVKVIR